MDGESGSGRYDKQDSIKQYASSGSHNLTLEHLRKMTNSFSEDLLLGQGSFGKVYKGVLQNGKMIAVKKFVSSLSTIDDDTKFKNEAKLQLKLKHRNIVLLVGYCSETVKRYVEHNGEFILVEEMPERLLCLEYMPKGDLRRYISDESSGLDWDKRFKIIEGISYGLHYLHLEWKVNTPIIHLDLKPENILLDNNMVPKITDFGLSRLFSENKTRTCTEHHKATLGYMALEYIHDGLITKKFDIFSLGVIILEIIMGHRNYPNKIGKSSQEFIEDYYKFIDCVLRKWRKRLEIAPRRTSQEIACQQIGRCIQIGLLCVDDCDKRPTSQIIKMLHGSEVIPEPFDLLEISPLELQVFLETEEVAPCRVKLTNKFNATVAFRFEVSKAKNKYHIEQAVGFLEAQSSINVDVTIENPEVSQCCLEGKDELLVQSALVMNHNVTASMAIDNDMFDTFTTSMVAKAKLTVTVPLMKLFPELFLPPERTSVRVPWMMKLYSDLFAPPPVYRPEGDEQHEYHRNGDPKTLPCPDDTSIGDPFRIDVTTTATKEKHYRLMVRWYRPSECSPIVWW